MLGFGPIGSSPIGAAPDLHVLVTVDAVALQPSIIQVASFVDLALIHRLHQFPEEMKTMGRRQFEELVAELFDGFGYTVELTKRTRDGGKDIIAMKNKEVELRYLIECKRPDPGHKVNVSTVRELHGVRADDGATKAILVTTSYFTPDAKEFFERNRWVLEPKDYDGVAGWIEQYLAIKK